MFLRGSEPQKKRLHVCVNNWKLHSKQRWVGGTSCGYGFHDYDCSEVNAKRLLWMFEVGLLKTHVTTSWGAASSHAQTLHQCADGARCSLWPHLHHVPQCVLSACGHQALRTTCRPRHQQAVRGLFVVTTRCPSAAIEYLVLHLVLWPCISCKQLCHVQAVAYKRTV